MCKILCVFCTLWLCFLYMYKSAIKSQRTMRTFQLMPEGHCTWCISVHGAYKLAQRKLAILHMEEQFQIFMDNQPEKSL